MASKNTPEDVALKILNLHSDDDGGEIGYEVPTQLKTVFMKLIDRSEFRDLIQAFEEKSQDELLIGKMHKALQHAKALEMRNRSECINARVIENISRQTSSNVFFTGQRANYFSSTGENPYRDFFRSNCSTGGNFRSNSKSPVQGKIIIFSLKLKVSSRGENLYFFAQTQSLQYSGKSVFFRSNSKSPIQGEM